MPDNIDFKFLSDQIQNCLDELFNEAYNKSQDFIKAVSEISIYLVGDSNTYDYVLKKYINVNKELLNRMILSNFLEITYYRRKNGIPVDKERLSILDIVECASPIDNVNLMDLVYFDAKQFFLMINDVLLYFWHLSPIYSYNAVQSIIKDEFAKKLYDIYSLAKSEHMLTLDDSYSPKELLLYTFYEILVNATEKIEFSTGRFPIPDSGYTQRLVNILKEYNGNNSELSNIHREILDTFTNRTHIDKNDNDKLLMVEIIISTIRAKQTARFPLGPEEKALIASFDKSDKTAESMSRFYDANQKVIVSSLINNWYYFSNEEILANLPELNDAKKERELHRKSI